MDLEAKKAIVRRIRRELDVTEVFCTRILKGSQGSVLVGLTSTLDKGTSLEEAEVATLLLGLKVDQLAYDRAVSDGVISSREYGFATQQTKINYQHMISKALDKLGEGEVEKASSQSTVVVLDFEIEQDDVPDVVLPLRMGGEVG